MASKLFGEQDFSFVVVVVPTTEARIGLRSQILKLVLEEGLLRAPGNIDIHKKILIVGTKVDRLDYEEDLVPWKETIAPHLLYDPDTNQPLGCPIVTTSIKGRGTEKYPYDAKIDDVKKWLCTVSTDIINGQKADQNRFEKGLQKLFGMDFSLHSLRAAADNLENMKENRGIKAWRVLEPPPEPEPELQNCDVKAWRVVEPPPEPDTKEEEDGWVNIISVWTQGDIVAGTACSLVATAASYAGAASAAAEEGAAAVAASSVPSVLPMVAIGGGAFVVGYTGYNIIKYIQSPSHSHDS